MIQYKAVVSIKLCLEGQEADCTSEGGAECSVKKTRAPASHPPSGAQGYKSQLKASIQRHQESFKDRTRFAYFLEFAIHYSEKGT